MNIENVIKAMEDSREKSKEFLETIRLRRGEPATEQVAAVADLLFHFGMLKLTSSSQLTSVAAIQCVLRLARVCIAFNMNEDVFHEAEALAIIQLDTYVQAVTGAKNEH